MSHSYPTQQQSTVPDVTPGTSSALLALKRFMRGPLRQLGIGLASLVVLLNVGVHTPEALVSPTSQFASKSNVTEVNVTEVAKTNAPHSALNSTHSSNAIAHPLSTSTPQQSAKVSGTSTTHPHLLSAHMTHHRLTGSRLSLPTAHNYAVAKLADAN